MKTLTACDVLVFTEGFCSPSLASPVKGIFQAASEAEIGKILVKRLFSMKGFIRGSLETIRSLLSLLVVIKSLIDFIREVP